MRAPNTHRSVETPPMGQLGRGSGHVCALCDCVIGGECCPDCPNASGAHLIAAERRRQVEAEGWDPSHDDHHHAGELARAAALYAMPDPLRPFQQFWHPGLRQWQRDVIPAYWPWSARDWKPTPDDRVRELVKAGALIAAEIDRLLREEATRG